MCNLINNTHTHTHTRIYLSTILFMGYYSSKALGSNSIFIPGTRVPRINIIQHRPTVLQWLLLPLLLLLPGIYARRQLDHWGTQLNPFGHSSTANGTKRYPFEFISQYAGSTKRYGILMTSSRSLLAIRLDLRYKTLFYKIVSSLVCTLLLRFVSLMVAYGLLLSRLFVNK